MTKKEYLLTCLSEEASEVIKDISKSLRFGMESNFKDGMSTNKENIRNEIIDFIAVAEMLVERGIIDDFTTVESIYEKEAKKEKVLKYMKVSKEIGTLIP